MSGVEIRQRAASEGQRAAGEGKRGSPPLYIGLAGALGEITNNEDRVVSLAWDMPTGPPLHSYQTLSNYV